MELSIHNRFIIRKLSICDSFWNQAAVLYLPGCDRGLWHLSSYSHNSLGDQYQGRTKDILPTQKVTDIHFTGWCDLCGEHGHPLQLAPNPHDHLPHLPLWQRSVFHQHIHISLQLSWPSSGALIYRIIPPKSEGHKLKLKIAHAIIMIVAFALMVIGLQVHSNQWIMNKRVIDSQGKLKSIMFRMFPGSFRQSQQGWPAKAQHVHIAQVIQSQKTKIFPLTLEIWY